MEALPPSSIDTYAKHCVFYVPVLAVSSCVTVQIPMPGPTILRPRAGLADAGARVSSGVATVPSIEATVTEIRDPNNFVINPKLGEPITEGGEPITESGTDILPAVDLAVDWKKRYEAGLSLSRGLFFMWDYASFDRWALTLTPSFGTVSREGGDPKLKTIANESGGETVEFDYTYKGTAQNFNVTQLASVWVGNVKWAAAYLYAGVGANFLSTTIKHTGTNETYSDSQVAPTFLGGIHLRLLIFEVTWEQDTTVIKYRDDKTKNVAHGGVQFSLHIAI